ncbi:MAG: hypothetical protein ABS76_31490 [Pelagibacterium sp. SCN 64-44]|nr:MAG: hypothetical protein ABS76_31490 [Pelagibacterium sp. SCN 64-44]
MKNSKPPLALRVFHLFLWLSVLAAMAYLVVPSLLQRMPPPPAVRVEAPALGPGVSLNMPFELVDQNGRTVTEEDFQGIPVAWFYGFTFCPDVCPTALSEMSQQLETLGPDADRLRMVFVSVDPERDNVAVMKQYVDYFDPRIIGLTGSLDAVTTMAKSRFIYFQKVPLEGDDYTMDHSANIYLTDAEGDFVGTLDDKEPFDIRLGKVRKLIG